ncbi:MAG: DMT family transporter [Alphaproteobacteria bacterium]
MGWWNALSGNLRGMVWMVVSGLCVIAMHVIIRHLANDIHAIELAFFRNLLGLPILLPFVLHHGVGLLRTTRLKLYLSRAGFHSVAMLSFYYALTITPLAMANALSFTGPLFAAGLAILVLGEKFHRGRITALVIGFAGTIVILHPDTDGVGLGAALVLASSAIFGAVTVATKSLSRTEPTVAIVIWLSLLLIPLTLVPALFVWTWPTWEQMLWLVLLGTVGTGAQLAITEALRVGDTAAIMPIDFFKLIWATLIGWALFGEIPDIWVGIGGLIVFAAATAVALGDRRRRPPAAANGGG